jgi:hypothetical protein
MRIEKTGKTPPRMPWVFAGSVKTDDGFAADYEGTVIALVDFGSSLIALPEQHSAANEELWLEPATDQIPPLSTRCVLVFRAGPLRIELDRTGRITLNGQTLTRAELARRLAGAVREDANLRVDLSVDPACPRAQREGIEQLIRLVGVRPENLATSRPAADADPMHDPAALRTWLKRQFTASHAAPDQARPAVTESLPRLIDDLRERGLLLHARAQGVSESFSALSRQAATFLSAEPSSREPDEARSE